MEYIYDKSGKLLHIIRRMGDVEDQEVQRFDIVAPENFIQCSSLNMKEGTTFKPHKHIYKERTYKKQIAQESWVVIRGRVKCFLYNEENELIIAPILKAGDCSFTLAGGHNYLILEDDTIVYEYKTGPYEGQEFDKIFIE